MSLADSHPQNMPFSGGRPAPVQAEAPEAVVVRDLHRWYGKVHAVRGVSFTLRRGEVVGLLGHNGAGKSTTIRMLAGALAPDLGEVSVCGHDMVTQRVKAARHVGYLPESTPLYPEMPVEDYLHFRATLAGMQRRARKEAVALAMSRCWLGDVRTRRISALSKGYRQRVGLASALVHDPAVLVLDEPTSGLDPSQVRETRELVRELSRERTTLICSHVLPEVEQLCGRVIVFAGGRVHADGSLESLAAGVEALIVAELKAPTPDAEDLLARAWKRIPGVLDVACVARRSSEGWSTWQVRGAPGADASRRIREALADEAAARAIVLRELRAQGTTLEQIFVRVLEEASRQEGGLTHQVSIPHRPGGPP